jgi:NAD(P)-dependent dehydrogenase (short-subunit alcohol dehydrogenase family)
VSRLEGRRAFITGAAKGIGRAAALRFAAEGAQVAIADIDCEGGEETARFAGAGAIFVETDVTVPEQVQAALDSTVESFGGLDILYNNAGGSTTVDGPVTEVPLDEFWRAIGLDLFGTFLVCKYGIPKLVAGGGGVVINTGSIVAMRGLPGRDSYTAAKGAVVALTRAIAAQYGRDGVRANVLAPGVVMTERVRKMFESDGDLQAAQERQFLGLSEPEHIAAAAAYLASDDAAMMTGQILPVDGGFTV